MPRCYDDEESDDEEEEEEEVVLNHHDYGYGHGLPFLRCGWLRVPADWLRRVRSFVSFPPWLRRRLHLDCALLCSALDACVSVLLLPLTAMQLVARNSQATAMLWVTLETAVELLAAVVMAGVSIFLASVLLLQDALEARRKQRLRAEDLAAEVTVTETY